MLREIVILCDERSADALCDELMDLGVMSVTVEDADADSPDERPLFGEPGMPVAAEAWPRSRLRLLVSEDFASGAVAEAARALGLAEPVIEAEEPVPDADWVRITQAQFQPSRISERLWIVPTWHEPPDPAAVNIRLDPGVAFGTGSHATTRLCLAWLDGNVTAADTVIDYGCGTGILAIAAARLGAARVAGTDIDPQAIEAARANAAANRVAADFCLPRDLPLEQASVVVANILANPLKVLAPALTARVAPGGRLVLSGVLARQAGEVMDAYRQAAPDMDVRVWQERDGWVCIEARRP